MSEQSSSYKDETTCRAVNSSKLSSWSPSPPDSLAALVVNFWHAIVACLAFSSGKRRVVGCDLQAKEDCVRAATRKRAADDIGAFLEGCGASNERG